MKSGNELNFKAKARQSLDRRLDELDAATLSRLRQAREKAIEKASGRILNIKWRMAVSAAVVAAVIVISVSMTVFRPTGVATSPGWVAQQEADVDMLVAPEELEFYQELEFLLWLDQSDYES